MLDSIYHSTLKYLTIAYLAQKRQNSAIFLRNVIMAPLRNVTKSVNH